MIEHKGKYAHHSYNGWVIECECGWKSATYRDRHDANQALADHIFECQGVSA